MEDRLLYISFILGIMTLLLSCSRSVNNPNKHHLPDRFVADSGYILKKEGIAFLLQIKSTDTIDVNNSDLKNNDTIGKYYKTKSGNYIACVLDIIHPKVNWHPVIIEYLPGNKIIKSEDYYGGMYLCCWNTNFDLFDKHGDYFSIKTCGTGSGFCSGNIYLFKEVEQQAESIPASAWSSWCAFQADGAPSLACSITSTIAIKADTVVIRYKLEHLKFEESEDQKMKNTM